MRIEITEQIEHGHIYAMARVNGEKFGVYGFLPDFLADTQGVLAEWRRFNRSVIEHFLRCNEIEFEVIDHHGAGGNFDAIDFGESETD